jgi:RHS repeat-associated protein
VSLTHDGRGNVSNQGATTYDYTSENRLATVGSPPNGLGGVSVAYDMVGRLFQLTQGTGVTRFDHLGSQLVTELSDSNVVLRRYVYGPGVDDPLVWYEGAGTTDKRWLISDERGSVIAVTNATGGLVTSGAATGINRYDEYGVPAAGNLGRFQYTGQAWLPELGLYYYKARMYAPTLGRFMQTDPIGYGDGVNWYNYVGGDPVNFKDPSGLRDLCWTRDASYGTWDSRGFVWVVTGESECTSFPEVIWETLTNGIQDRISLTGDSVQALVCSLPSLGPSVGLSAYAGLGGGVSGGIQIDPKNGQISISGGIDVGAGVGAGASFGTRNPGINRSRSLQGGYGGSPAGFTGGVAATGNVQLGPVAFSGSYEIAGTASKNDGSASGRTSIGAGLGGTGVNANGNLSGYGGFTLPALWNIGC